MATDTSWVAILGAASGLSALFLRLVDYVRKPRLVMSKHPYVRRWQISSAKTWNFVNFEVMSRRGLSTACEAKAIAIRHPENVTLVKELTEEGYGLHWADTPYSGRSTGVDRVDIGATPQRLDVAFTVSTLSSQSHLAIPIALSALWNNPTAPVRQSILPRGEYIFKIRVSSANGGGDTKAIKLFSPNNWQDMRAERIRCPSLMFMELANWLKRFRKRKS